MYTYMRIVYLCLASIFAPVLSFHGPLSSVHRCKTPLDVMADHHILLSLPPPCVANPAPFCSTFLLVVLFFISPSAFTHLRVSLLSRRA